MTRFWGPAALGVTDDRGSGTAAADLAMTDDRRVGHASTVCHK